MKKPLAAHRNYSNAEIVLLFTMLFMIAAIGLYVNNAKNNADAALMPVTSTAKSVNPGPLAVKPADAKTTLSSGVYTSANKLFTVRLADGWKLTHSRDDDNGVFTFNNDNLAQVANAAPTIIDTSIKGASSSGLFMELNYTNSVPRSRGIRQADLKTNDGLTISKYAYTEVRDQGASESKLATGGLEYTYLIAFGARTMVVVYAINPGMTNYRDTVESVVKSFRFN